MAYNTPSTLLGKLYDSFTYSEELNECEMLKSDKQSHVTPNLHDFFALIFTRKHQSVRGNSIAVFTKIKSTQVFTFNHGTLQEEKKFWSPKRRYFLVKLIFFVETMHVLKKTTVIREHKVYK